MWRLAAYWYSLHKILICLKIQTRDWRAACWMRVASQRTAALRANTVWSVHSHVFWLQDGLGAFLCSFHFSFLKTIHSTWVILCCSFESLHGLSIRPVFQRALLGCALSSSGLNVCLPGEMPPPLLSSGPQLSVPGLQWQPPNSFPYLFSLVSTPQQRQSLENLYKTSSSKFAPGSSLSFEQNLKPWAYFIEDLWLGSSWPLQPHLSSHPPCLARFQLHREHSIPALLDLCKGCSFPPGKALPTTLSFTWRIPSHPPGPSTIPPPPGNVPDSSALGWRLSLLCAHGTLCSSWDLELLEGEGRD